MKTLLRKRKTERLTERKASTVFFVTDAGNLLLWRRNMDIWRIFNPLSRKWEEPPFDIADLYDTLLITKEDAAKVMKRQLKINLRHPYKEGK